MDDPFEMINVNEASLGLDEVATSLRFVSLASTDAENDNSRMNVNDGKNQNEIKDEKKEHGTEDKIKHDVQNKNDNLQVDDKINNVDDKKEIVEYNKEEECIRQKVQCLQSPFTWNFDSNASQNDIITKTITKINEVQDDDMFKWRHFTLTLILCYEYCQQGDMPTAWEKLWECESTINSVDSKGIYEDFYRSTRNALLHVVLACKCELFINEGKFKEVEVILEKLVEEEDMDNSSKAALWGIKAVVSMEYGYAGTKEAFGYAEKALGLDKEEAEWHFLLGKCYSRIRRVEYYNEIPALDELKALEEAVRLRQSPSYIIFLAQSYREASFRVFSIHRHYMANDLKENIDGMNKRSHQLYRKALELRPTCAHINIRCAQGFLKLAHPYRDIAKAKECALKAEELAPNNAMTNHVLGNIYEIEKNYDKAREYYKKSGDQGAYGAYMDLLKMEYKTNETHDPVPQLEEMLERFKEAPRKEEILCQLGSYYFFKKNDLVTAYTKYWGKVIEENQDSYKLKTHKCIFLLEVKKPLDIYELIYSEAQYLLKSDEVKTNENLKKVCREIIIKCWAIKPDLDNVQQQPLRKIILHEASLAQSNARGRSRGRGRGGRGRGAGKGRGRGEDTRGNNSSVGSRSEHQNRDCSADSKTTHENPSYGSSCRNRSQDPRVDTNERSYRSDWGSECHCDSRSRDSSVESRGRRSHSKGRNYEYDRPMNYRGSSGDRRVCSCNSSDDFQLRYSERESGCYRSREHSSRNWRGMSDSSRGIEQDGCCYGGHRRSGDYDRYRDKSHERYACDYHSEERRCSPRVDRMEKCRTADWSDSRGDRNPRERMRSSSRPGDRDCNISSARNSDYGQRSQDIGDRMRINNSRNMREEESKSERVKKDDSKYRRY